MAARTTISPFKWLFLVVLLLALSVFGTGIWLANENRGWTMLAAGCASVIIVLAAWPFLFALEELGFAAEAQKQELSERLQQISILLNTISEQQLLSDRARAVAYREKDREALRRAIHEEIAKRDFEAALVLTNDMEAAFGYKQEADRFRIEIENRRSDDIRRQINDAVALIDRHARGENWAEAIREAERVMNLYPEHPQAQTLPQEVESRRQTLKRTLMDQLRDADQRNDVEGGIEIVKRLDLYLTPAEAEGVRDTARSIFRQKLVQLGQQFTAAVNEDRQEDAVRIGEEIVRDYPNTRMAQEVRERLTQMQSTERREPVKA